LFRLAAFLPVAGAAAAIAAEAPQNLFAKRSWLSFDLAVGVPAMMHPGDAGSRSRRPLVPETRD